MAQGIVNEKPWVFTMKNCLEIDLLDTVSLDHAGPFLMSVKCAPIYHRVEDLPPLPSTNCRRTARLGRSSSQRHPIARNHHIVAPIALCPVVRTSPHSRVLRCAGFLGLLVVLGVDFEEVVKDNHHHGTGAKEDGETVEIIVRDHGEGNAVVV